MASPTVCLVVRGRARPTGARVPEGMTGRAATATPTCSAATRYAYSPDTVYEPHPSQAGTTAKFLAVLDAHGMTHGLLVGAGPYGPDNRCLLDGIAGSGGRLKGIALVQADVPIGSSPRWPTTASSASAST